ncbi:methyltransferase domain-containing protein [Streptomyces sp. NPDC059255]|uniref:methyltransferase domain-containing protein n=1 Tax=Streptomyces sp. NPDC059255 TaxID=3346793 RepID=UPI0036B39DC2
MNGDTVEETYTAAERLRDSLVDQAVTEGRVRTPRIEKAMRTVPRHLFAPEVPLEEAYANRTVSIKNGDDGASISCASQPSVIGLMLEQLQVQPGESVLELGAGTGYNAALLAHLTGADGRVVTLDVDDDIVEGAHSNLATAGFSNVEVILRDGAVGHADGAPYPKIVDTVGAHGIAR